MRNLTPDKMELTLLTPAQYLKGVGPRMAEKMAQLGINTIEDLIRYYPRDWEDRRCKKRIGEARIGETIALYGSIRSFDFTETPRGFAIAHARVKDHTGEIDCRWLRRRSYKYDVLQSFKRAFEIQRDIMVFGEVGLDKSGKSVSVKEYQIINGIKENLIHLDRIVPIYPTTEGLSVSFLREAIHRTLPQINIPDPIPQEIISEQKLCSLIEALKSIHFPKTLEEKNKARDRLAFEEFFMLQTVLALVRQRKKITRAYTYQIKRTLLTPFKNACGFDFTQAQKRAINEIFFDMQSPAPMNRLLQGDVGSGKTVVALSAMLLAAENSIQSVLMAPTELLAEQHYITLKNFLKDLPVTVSLLTGSSDHQSRENFIKGCLEGKIQMAVGTHALLEDNIQFLRLGLVVIDEQHRFGVKHRLRLTHRKPQPDTLVMTATPIPRTLTLGLYGDLDLSVIDQLPPGRQSIQTSKLKEQDAFKIVKEEIKKGRQAYVVCPLIDETKSKRISEDREENEILPALDLESVGLKKLKAAMQESERLSRIFKDMKIALLHGKMKRADKEKIMADFKLGQYDVLVSTTVIEVGIDIPNASVMVIENAERFGLSTLHQLRGRVGRGKHLSHCLLISQDKTETSKKRLDIILRSQNGFEIAEEDLNLRGPGEIFGTNQHGLPPFKIANFSEDLLLLKMAQDSARRLIEKDPNLSQPHNLLLKTVLNASYSGKWSWSTIA